MKAEIICVGTEILLGNIVNTNSAYISQKLSEIGVDLYYHTVVGDNEKRLLSAIDIGAKRSDILILTGGLGPTYDDITKEAVAKAFNKDLHLDNASLKMIEDYFAKTNRKMTQNNIKQAYIINDSTVLTNPNGTAPGMILEAEYDGKNVISILMPGPPSEMTAMLNDSVLPYLNQRSGVILHSHTIRIYGIGESKVESDLKDLMENSVDPTIAPYAKTGEVELRITSKSKTVEEADSKIIPILKLISDKYGDNAYGIDVPNLETALVKKLKENGLTISFAESCTGGLLAKRVTDVLGASSVIGYSLVTYSNEAKEKLLGVSAQTLKDFGAVSEQCAKEMAIGMKKLSNSNIALSITGVAGPDESEGKKVGTIYIGIATDSKVEVKEILLGQGRKYSRDMIRTLSSSNALYLALTTI